MPLARKEAPQNTNPCKDCGRQILWAKVGYSEQWVPLDLESSACYTTQTDPKGNVHAFQSRAHINHAITCPKRTTT